MTDKTNHKIATGGQYYKSMTDPQGPTIIEPVTLVRNAASQLSGDGFKPRSCEVRFLEMSFSCLLSDKERD